MAGDCLHLDVTTCIRECVYVCVVKLWQMHAGSCKVIYKWLQVSKVSVAGLVAGQYIKVSIGFWCFTGPALNQHYPETQEKTTLRLSFHK
mgnify:CR=1 FL=1